MKNKQLVWKHVYERRERDNFEFIVTCENAFKQLINKCVTFLMANLSQKFVSTIFLKWMCVIFYHLLIENRFRFVVSLASLCSFRSFLFISTILNLTFILPFYFILLYLTFSPFHLKTFLWQCSKYLMSRIFHTYICQNKVNKENKVK